MWLFVAAICWGADPDIPEITGSDATSWRFGWGVVQLRPAVPESPAIGPDRLAVGPGVVAWSDPVASTVVVARTGSIVGTIPTFGLDDLAFAGGDLVLLEGRTLRRVDVTGRALGRIEISPLIPSDVALEVRDDLVVGVDVFGNSHAIAALNNGLTREDGRLVPSSHLRRVPEGLSVDGVVFLYPGKVAGRVVGDWLIVDRVAEVDGRVRVAREAVSLRDHRVVQLPETGLYAPTRSVAAGADGSLWALDPQPSGLRVLRVSP